MSKIETTYIDTTHTYEIKNFDQTKQACELFINDILEQVDPNNLKQVRKLRTELNNKAKEIKNARKVANEIVIGTFNSNAKELESMLENASKSLTDILNQEKENNENQEKEWTLTGFSTKKESLEQIKKYAYETFKITLTIK